MPGQIPYIPFVGSKEAQETPAPKRTKSASGEQKRFASGTPAETDQAPGFALMGKPAPAHRSIIPDRPSMGTFTHPVDISRGKGRGRTKTFEYGPGKISIPYGPDPGKVSLAMHMPRPETSAFTMEQKSSERLNTILETVGKILTETRYSGAAQDTDIPPDFPHSQPDERRMPKSPRSILDFTSGGRMDTRRITQVPGEVEGPGKSYGKGRFPWTTAFVSSDSTKPDPNDQRGRWDARRGVRVVPPTSPDLEMR